MQGGQIFEDRLRAAIAVGAAEVATVLSTYDPARDAVDLNKVYTEQWNQFLYDQTNLTIINSLYAKISKQTAVDLATRDLRDVTLDVRDGVTVDELRLGLNFALNEAEELANAADLGDFFADGLNQVGHEGQDAILAQGDAGQMRRTVIVEHGQRPRVEIQQPNVPNQQQGPALNPNILPDPNVQAQNPANQQPSQPVIPQARQPVVVDPFIALRKEIKELGTTEAGLLKQSDFTGGEPAAKKAIRERLLGSMGDGGKALKNEPFNQDAPDPYTKMVNKKVNALYDKHCKNGNEPVAVAKLEEEINEVRSKILQQAYLCKGSIRPFNVAEGETSKKDREAAIEAFNTPPGFTKEQIKEALRFEYRRDPETPIYDSLGQLGSSTGRFLSTPFVALARAPGAIIDNVSDSISKNKASTATTVVGGYMALFTFIIPGVLPFALLVGVPALLVIGIVKAAGYLPESVLKTLGVIAALPLDAIASGLSAGFATIAALCKMSNGKSFAENFKDSLPYKPFSASMAIKDYKSGDEPEKKFENTHEKFVKDKGALDKKITDLSPPDMARALMDPDKTISDYLLNKGLMSKILGDKAVTDALGPVNLVAKLTEFLDKNPPKDQIKTMLEGNPGLQAVITTNQALAGHQAVAPVMQELQHAQAQQQNLAPLGQALQEQVPIGQPNPGEVQQPQNRVNQGQVPHIPNQHQNGR